LRLSGLRRCPRTGGETGALSWRSFEPIRKGEERPSRRRRIVPLEQDAGGGISYRGLAPRLRSQPTRQCRVWSSAPMPAVARATSRAVLIGCDLSYRAALNPGCLGEGSPGAIRRLPVFMPDPSAEPTRASRPRSPVHGAPTREH
jgi:hypothetical protein